MKFLPEVGLAAGLLFNVGQAASPSVRLETRSVLDSRVANVHVDYDGHVDGDITFGYGGCLAPTARDLDHVIARGPQADKSHRLVWVKPREFRAGGCISAWDASGNLLGRSAPQHPQKRRRGASIPMNNSTGIDVWGPWFDGVALLEKSSDRHVDVEAAKAKEIAIVGAGMSGLTSYLVLHQAGFTNLSLIEGSHRLGGRVRTEYLSGGEFDYSYQEMGPMRIPHKIYLGNKTYEISDQGPTFRMVEELNRINKEGGNDDLHVNLIPFIQFSNNGLQYFNGNKMENGLPPTVADVTEDPSLGDDPPAIPESAQELAAQVNGLLPGQENLADVAANIWQAHSDWIEGELGPDGMPGDQWSEFAFMVNYLNGSVFDANAVSGGYDQSHYFSRLYYQVLFSPQAEMKTVDGGMNRLPNAFESIVGDTVRYDQKVERIQWDEKTERLTLQWRGNYTDPKLESESFDYAIMSAPLPVLGRMRLPDLPYALTNAISNMHYGSACKVALEYRSRFWEKFDNPIYGSCATSTDIPGIGEVCYPSYNINGTGPATVLATYAQDRPGGVVWTGVADEQHVQYVVDAMAEIHGDVAYEEYTGNWRRKCWVTDELASGGWAAPTIGNHEVYLPEFFTTHSHMIFVGEHTSITHAWISAAIESGIRGAVQMLLELGLVDEAQEAVDKWMARWISV